MKLWIGLYIGVAVLVLIAAAPQKRSTIDFLLDFNQDILMNDTEVPASVKPLTLAQVSSKSEESGINVQQDSQREEIADVQETQNDSRSNEKESNEDRESQEEHNESDDEKQSSIDHRKNEDKDDDVSETDEKHSKEDTTIRVYDEAEEDQKLDEKHEDSHSTQNSTSQDNHTPEHQDRSQSDHSEEDNSKESEIQPVSSEEIVPHVTESNPGHAIEYDTRNVEVQPDQLFNHGSLIFDKNSFVNQKPELSTPYSVKNWKDFRNSDTDNWHHKFDFLDQEKDTRFTGTPPSWVHWHQNHQHDDHDHRGHKHFHDHEETGFHGHGFHRGGAWKWH